MNDEDDSDDSDDKLGDDELFDRDERRDREYLWLFIGCDRKDNDVAPCDSAFARGAADELFGDRRVLHELEKSHPELVVVAYRKVLYAYLSDLRIYEDLRAPMRKPE